MYINLKKSNVNHYKMARASLKIKLGTQEDISYPRLMAERTKGQGKCLQLIRGSVPLLSALFSLCLGSLLACLPLNMGKGTPAAVQGFPSRALFSSLSTSLLLPRARYYVG